MRSKRRLEKQKQMPHHRRMHMADLRQKEARGHYNAQHFQRALDTYDEAIDLDPAHVGAHKGRADTFYALERYEEACRSYQRCILLDKYYVLAYEGHGNALYALKRYKEAYNAYEKAIWLKLDQNIYFGKWKKFVTDGEEFHRLGLFEDALAAYELAILFNQSHSKGYTGKGNALFALGHTEEAQAMHKQAKIKSLSYHANEKHNTGNYEESLNLYEQLLELDPINAQANRRAGDALFALEQYQKALTFYGKVLQIDPQNAYAYKRKGDTFFAL
ncbi:MAG TPA: tetratricopeptide repeat protein, partial [Methylomirabilota bacterium]|nr:tetratricopeptide repeat protein [Methylomirabilota bacterium]